MPGMDGIELCRWVRQIPRYHQTPIIMLTAMRDMKNMGEAYRAGATDYATKPFDIEDLGMRLRVAQETVQAQRETGSGDQDSSGHHRRPVYIELSRHLADKGITLRSGTLVGATIIDAPSSTKNKAGARDPEMLSTNKGDGWYFGMNAHIGVDADSGVTHSLDTSTAKLHDSQVWDDLLHGKEKSVWADKGYVSAEREAWFEGPGKFWGVRRKAPKGKPLHPIEAQINRSIAMVRAKVEHPFRVIKRRFGYVKTRYRGLAKNRAQLFTLFALGNLFLMRRKLMA